MPELEIVTYGHGGYDPEAADDNVVERKTVEAPEDPVAEARELLADGDVEAALDKLLTALGG